jgi:hypothetical protein
MIFVGLDGASTAHAVCVLDPTGTVHWRGSGSHSAEGLAELLRRLRQFGPPETVQVAIERPSGVVIDTLLEAGVRVVPIHPNVVKASRARSAAAHPKSDGVERRLHMPRDAVVVSPDDEHHDAAAWQASGQVAQLLGGTHASVIPDDERLEPIDGLAHRQHDE